MCIFASNRHEMKRLSILLTILLAFSFVVLAQQNENQYYKAAFELAYQTCPDIPQGMLEAISFTNTQCHHLTDANYFHDGPDAMPRAYG